ncbi:hypothetical protein RclHR1_03380002 [Rhizophagus clarus]|uniref:Uncharacterized protein n=1 Tax=Rhizophagus clarus TaxID=94130 RepID=A0A2Z6RA80_9GLOM|nr:hypothetical protein RclHR1_03380002 [Rhizophagus clarus]
MEANPNSPNKVNQRPGVCNLFLNAQKHFRMISGLDTEVILQNIKSVKVLKTILKNINYNVEVLNMWDILNLITFKPKSYMEIKGQIFLNTGLFDGNLKSGQEILIKRKA